MNRYPIAVVAACVAIVLPSAAHADLKGEAERQLLFARGELEAGRFDAALKSSESAMRLDPSLYRALVIKALALEGLGESKTAEAILIAYFELTKGMTPDELAVTALGRLQGGAPTVAGSRAPAAGKPLIIGEVTAKNAGDVATRLRDQWTGSQFVLRYDAHCEDDGDEHEFGFGGLDFYVRFDRGGEFKVRGGDNKYAEDTDGWRCGGDTSNSIEVFFDGDRVWATAADEKHAPTWVRGGRANPAQLDWELKLTDGTRLERFQVAPWSSVEIEPIARKKVKHGDLGDWADEVSDDWEQGRWHLAYAVTHEDDDAGHTIDLPGLGFYFRVEGEGKLVVRGLEGHDQQLRSRWFIGGEPNRVELWFDGDSLRAQINGGQYGPWRVRKNMSNARETKWVWKLKDDDDAFTDLVLDRWTPAPF
jgi:hypothetical protein